MAQVEPGTLDTIRGWITPVLALATAGLTVLLLLVRSRFDGVYVTKSDLEAAMEGVARGQQECTAALAREEESRKRADAERDHNDFLLRQEMTTAIGRVEVVERSQAGGALDRQGIHERIGEVREAQRVTEARIREAEMKHQQTLTEMAKMEARLGDRIAEAIREVQRLYTHGERRDR